MQVNGKAIYAFYKYHFKTSLFSLRGWSELCTNSALSLLQQHMYSLGHKANPLFQFFIQMLK